MAEAVEILQLLNCRISTDLAKTTDQCDISIQSK